MFRPNLENPANKDATAELNNQEVKRSEDMKDVRKLIFNKLFRWLTTPSLTC